MIKPVVCIIKLDGVVFSLVDHNLLPVQRPMFSVEDAVVVSFKRYGVVAVAYALVLHAEVAIQVHPPWNGLIALGFGVWLDSEFFLPLRSEALLDIAIGIWP